MIARVWSADASVANGPRYVEHLEQSVLPELAVIPGHRSARLLQRTVGDRVEFMVVTLWESMDAIRQFAGDEMETAVVEPAAQAVLGDFDKHVTHYEIVLGPEAAERRTGD